MKMTNQNIEGCLLIHNNIFDDERGIFFEAMNQKTLNDLNVPKIEQVIFLNQIMEFFEVFIIRFIMN